MEWINLDGKNMKNITVIVTVLLLIITFSTTAFAGDNSSKKYQDSFGKTSGRISLTKNWKQYEINFANVFSVGSQ